MSQEQEDIHWMRRALDLARQAEQAQEVPVGAVIVRDGVVLGEGFNQPIARCDPTSHAEIVALRQACASERNYRIPGATLYVTVEPCSMCAGAILHARIDRVVFGAEEPKAGAVISAQRFFDQPFVNYAVTYEGGCLAQECSALMSDFFAARRKLKRQLKADPPADPKP
ncbi:MAG: tRNA adenosine(34) deaminase TadA [Pseudomonadota bacterium]|nr:tRNA adenosine(34) deaminase TadA [Pseudomonadota bacterium]